MMNGMEKLFKKAEEDKELAEKVFEAESAVEVKQIAAEVGIELTEKEIKEAGKAIVEELKSMNKEGELSEEDLDNVAGGIAGATAFAAIGAGAAVVGAGAGVVAAGAAVTRAGIAVDDKVQRDTGKHTHEYVIDTVSGWF